MADGGPAARLSDSHEEWRNWSGSLHFHPGALVEPSTEDGVRSEIRRAAAAGVTVRPVGAGHSSAPLVETDGVLLSLNRLPAGVLDADPAAGHATIGAGTRLCFLHDDLRGHGLAMENLGDVDTQALAGAVSTATHGSGRGLPNLSAQMIGVRMVTADGEVADIDRDEEPDLMRAVRVSLGVLGVFTAIRLRLLPAFRARRREWGMPIDECLATFDELLENNRNVDFYWYPRRDDAHLRIINSVDHDPGPVQPPAGTCTDEEIGWSGQILTKHRTLRFHEMEYAVPAESGVACFTEVRERMKQHHRQYVGWRVLYRYVAADDAYLSPAHGRETVTISLHQNSTLPYREFFADIEPIFRAHGGRPHWAKIHNLSGRRLIDLYPEAGRFLAIRDRLDPRGVFINDHLRALLGL